MDNSESSSYSGFEHLEPVSKKKKYEKRFRTAWMEGEYQRWLQPVDTDPSSFFCALCQKPYKGGFSEIKKHAATKNHVEALFAAGDRKSVV